MVNFIVNIFVKGVVLHAFSLFVEFVILRRLRY